MKKITLKLFRSTNAMVYFFTLVLIFYGFGGSLAFAHNGIVHTDSDVEKVGEHVESFNVDIKVDTSGSVDVHEKIVYSFGPNLKHGIFRYIPVVFKNSVGTLKTKISKVSVTDENLIPYNFTVTNSEGNLNIKVGNADSYVSGTKTYFINYTIDRVINFFDNQDEFYWNVTGNGWEVPILQASAVVTLPSGVSTQSIKVQCYFGFQGSKNNCEKLEVVNNKAIFSQVNLEGGFGLTVVVGFNKGVVIQPSTGQIILQIISDNYIAFFPVIVFIFMFWLWFKKGRDPETSSVIVPEYEAPNGITPGQAAQLVSFSNSSRGITAEIIQLAVLGYLKINNLNNDYELIQLKKSDSLMNEHQKILLDALFGFKDKPSAAEKIKAQMPEGVLRNILLNVAEAVKPDNEKLKTSPDSVILSSLKDEFYTSLQKVKQELALSLIKLGYFPNSPASVIIGYTAVGVALMLAGTFFGSVNGLVWFISFFVAGLIIVLFGLVMPRRTLKGVKVLRQVMGLKMYLNVAEKDRINFHNAPEKKPEVFEKLLPYAIALGVEKQWAKQFEGIYSTPPKWYGNNYTTFNSLILINSLNNFHSTSSDVLSSAPSSASSGGSGFSGGGSGGGFGGGGGGSW
jgi:uncharacterized membrane protein YgcG